MRKYKWILRPNGTLYINDFLINNDDRNVSRYNLHKDRFQTYGVFESNDGVILRHHAIEWINELTVSFEKILLETVTFTTMNDNKSNGLYFFGRNIKI